MAGRTLWKRKCEFSKEDSVWYCPWVVTICIKELEFFVKHICRSDRNETVPLRQTVTDGSIDYPEVIATALKGGSPFALKSTVLINVSRFQQGTQSRGVEKIDPQGNTICLNGFCVIRKPCIPCKPFPLGSRAER